LSQALYRKYRSKQLSEIVGQEHITTTLERALASGHISHAYLFTGPRGVGKTSIARILAHQINDLPYTDETTHLDIIEIDAASNRRIDEIRDLRDKVHLAPTSGKYKEAFNALLKTLEEPPAHVVFMLATTEAHKLPDTIISRTQRFTLKPIEPSAAIAHLKHIATSEGIKIEDDALTLLAEHGNGSFRDSISLLDQVRSGSSETITRADIERLLGIAPAEAVLALLTTTIQGQPKAILDSLQSLIEQGVSPASIAKQLHAVVRDQLIDGRLQLTQATAMQLLKDLLTVPTVHYPLELLELTLLEVALQHTAPTIAAAPAPAAPVAAAPAAPVQPVTSPKTTAVTEPVQASSKATTSKKSTTAKAPEVAAPASPLQPGAPAAWWPEVLNEIKQHNNTLYGVLRMAHASVTNDTLLLGFAFPFHQKRVSDSRTKQKVSEIVDKVSGQKLAIDCVLDPSLKNAPQPVYDTSVTAPHADIAPPAAAEPSPSITVTAINAAVPDAITSIFGGGEVLEQ
jgi:DNA polymerase-3 subunit gamma/tau